MVLIAPAADFTSALMASGAGQAARPWPGDGVWMRAPRPVTAIRIYLAG